MYTTTSDPSDGYSNHWSNGSSDLDLDLSLIDNIELDNVSIKDAPDFSDAMIIAADYKGREMTEEELDWLADNHSDFIHEEVINQLY